MKTDTLTASTLELSLTDEWETVIKHKVISWKGFLEGKKRRAAKHNNTDLANQIQTLIDKSI